MNRLSDPIFRGATAHVLATAASGWTGRLGKAVPATAWTLNLRGRLDTRYSRPFTCPECRYSVRKVHMDFSLHTNAIRFNSFSQRIELQAEYKEGKGFPAKASSTV
jgi:hypothetical protein